MRDQTEVDERTDFVFTSVDALRGVASRVLGLPCVCDTPTLHSDVCAAVRQLLMAVDYLRKAVQS